MLHHVLNYNTFQIPYHKLRIEDGLLIATRHAKPEHLLKKPLAWSYNLEIVEAMKKAGVDVMKVVYEGKIFSCPLQRFLKYAIRMNRGFGEQLFLPLQYWDTQQVSNPAKKAGEKQLVQPSLFS